MDSTGGGARAAQGGCLLGGSSGPLGQQVLEEAEGGARARTASNSLTPPRRGPGTFAKPGRRKPGKLPTPACADVLVFDARRPHGACSQGVMGKICARVLLGDTLAFYSFSDFANG